jgi:hypothetical protein
MSSLYATRQRWQPPRDGLPERHVSEFWRRVEIRPDGERSHWIWQGSRYAEQGGTMSVDGRGVSAVRIAHAIVSPGEHIPPRMKRNSAVCPYVECVNPACFVGHKDIIDSERVLPRGFAQAENGGADGPNKIGGVTVPPLIAAMAHEQFDLEVTPVRRIFSPNARCEARVVDSPLVFENTAEVPKTDESQPFTLATKVVPVVDGEARTVTVTGLDQHDRVVTERLPLADTEARSRRGWRGHADLDAEAVLDALLQPGTSTVTFPSGAIWIFGPHGVRINEADHVTALRKLLVRLHRPE